MKQFPYYQQLYEKDCGPACLRMISEFYGKSFDPKQISNLARINRRGSSLLALSEAAERIGFDTVGLHIELRFLQDIDLPVILHWNHQHFVVLFKIERGKYYVADPAAGIVEFDESVFMDNWRSMDSVQGDQGIVLTFSTV